MNILVIDDSKLLRTTLSQHLLEKGHTVTSAENGQDAIEKLNTNIKVDLIVCDILMPVASGPTFILLLNKYFKGKMPTMVVISGANEGEKFIKKLDVKYDYFLAKPFEFRQLDEIIEKVGA